jgi:hypothetical protein
VQLSGVYFRLRLTCLAALDAVWQLRVGDSVLLAGRRKDLTFAGLRELL